MTPLHIAAKDGHKDTAALLLDHGAKVDVADKVRPWSAVLIVESRLCYVRSMADGM